MDIIGLFPQTDKDNLYVLVAADYFTLWVEAYAIPNQEAVLTVTLMLKLKCLPPWNQLCDSIL